MSGNASPPRLAAVFVRSAMADLSKYSNIYQSAIAPLNTSLFGMETGGGADSIEHSDIAVTFVMILIVLIIQNLP
ncbi:MAG: hypothetical protein LBK41_00410 [Clostridiales bacterium]|nr:hypothetical protein [Clostridiales bacterium]